MTAAQPDRARVGAAVVQLLDSLDDTITAPKVRMAVLAAAAPLTTPEQRAMFAAALFEIADAVTRVRC